MKENKKLNDAVAQHHMLFFNIIRHVMLLILSKDQTISRLVLSELHVVMSKYDLEVNIQASDLCDKLFMERCVCGHRKRNHHIAFC